MDKNKEGQKGFTLIELLIVVAILGVLAAVVIPNVSQFLGRGKTEAAATELSTVQSAVSSMMVDQSIASLPAPVTGANGTDDMSQFPSPSLTPSQDYVLFHFGGNSSINYINSQIASHSYNVTAQGFVTQTK